MTQRSVQPGTGHAKSRLSKVNDVVVYGRKDERGRLSIVDAIDRDEQKIASIADHLWRRGFGVMRQKSKRAGKVFYLFRATWAGAGEPPDDPFEGVT
jgi:hypothetical protein